jgi:putative MATE family efflux protein
VSAAPRADSLDRRILALAVPAAGSALLVMVHRAVDMHFASRLGTGAAAGMGISIISVWMFSAAVALVCMGIMALVARYAGAGRLDAAGYVAVQGLRWTLLVGATMAVLGWLLTPWIYRAAGATAEVAREGAAYTKVYWAGGAALLLQSAGDAVFRAHGNTRVPFAIALVALLVHAGLDPILVFGWGPVPALGLAGAAWATVASCALGAALSLLALRSRGHLRRERPPDDELRLDASTRLGRPGPLGMDAAVFLRITRVGVPAAASSVLFNAIYLWIYSIVQEAGGPAAQAGLAAGHNGESMAFVVCLGWAAAASALVGRHLGAGDPEGAARCAWRAALQCAALSAAWGAVLFVFDGPIASLFADGDAEPYARSYFRIVALCLAPQAFEIVLDGAFGGAGMTLPPMLVAATFSVLRIPLSLLVVHRWGWGVDGVWGVIAVTAALRGAACALWFARGTWKARTV